MEVTGSGNGNGLSDEEVAEIAYMVQQQHELIVFFYRRVKPFMERVQRYMKECPPAELPASAKPRRQPKSETELRRGMRLAP